MRFNIITTCLTLVLLLLHLSIHLQAYTPAETFTLSCGATGKSSDGERTWTGDTDSKLLSLQDGSVSAKATKQSPSTNQVPFSTARLSRSQFNYSFPVSAGPKFVRLFFYPASYSSFPRSDASFTVQSNQFTLLNGFNTSLNAYAENKDTIFREYVVNVDDSQRLTLSFTPSQPNSYAFINGIEVLSMPSDLYYTSDMGFKIVGNDNLYSVETNSALETDYRIKVGGQGISERNDTGLFRNWAGHDEDYLITQFSGLPADEDGKMNMTVNPDYVAPKDLYRSARDMGPNATLNKMNNLTWEFPVDTGFTYMVRLHFCELDPNIIDVGYRVFIIYIQRQVAEDHADVMEWSHSQKGLAVQRNYAVLIPKNDESQKRYNLSLQMHPYEDSSDSIYSKPFLNGVEIFKISEPGSNNLAGPNPDPVHTPQTNQNKKSSSGSKTTMINNVMVGAICGSAFSFGLGVVLIAFSSARTGKWSFKWCQLWLSKTKSTNTLNSSPLSNLCRHFSLVEIKIATKNFDDIFIVGVGGFGHVYRGYINGGSTPVAIKRLKPGSQQGPREFMNEIEMLSQLRHPHLVSLIGYCNDRNEMIIVYDFMACGNLRDHLYDTDKPPLSWKRRLQICIGAARGLNYLHSGTKHMIIHRDVKTTNILLDEEWVAKVSDFGLSRIGSMDKSKAHVSTAVKGSFGYLDPEYYNLQRLTEKSDVYSFGVVLFEILCARPPLIHTAETEQLSLANWARHCYRSGTMAQIVDPILKGRIGPECFEKFCEIGVSCLLQDGTQRPSMNDVVSMLECALQLQESADQCENVGVLTQVVDEKRQENSEDALNSRDHGYGCSSPLQ